MHCLQEMTFPLFVICQSNGELTGVQTIAKKVANHLFMLKLKSTQSTGQYITQNYHKVIELPHMNILLVRYKQS